MGRYLSLTVDLPESDLELAQAALYEAGALGMEVRERGLLTMPGQREPLPGEAILVAFFADSERAQQAASQLGRSIPSSRTRLDEVEDADWSTSWKALIRPVSVGRLWVGPPWARTGAPPGAVQVVVEPKMAFGTGDHPTTLLCLEAVDGFLSAHPGATVLDVGTGTGVLAIAALGLGASRAVGLDNDPMAVEVAKECAGQNLPGWEREGKLVLSGATLPELSGRYDLVLANILANTLVQLAPQLAEKVGQRLVLSGLLTGQREEVEAAYRPCGLSPAGSQAMGEWIRLDFER
ncbi:MAG: 50S ribosomal protein L11 methyltransferase [Myxococcales bacterium]|nr:50S ribosomal protein L11 methyltransferase [Myxococcales bacterium]